MNNLLLPIYSVLSTRGTNINILCFCHQKWYCYSLHAHLNIMQLAIISILMSTCVLHKCWNKTDSSEQNSPIITLHGCVAAGLHYLVTDNPRQVQWSEAQVIIHWGCRLSHNLLAQPHDRSSGLCKDRDCLRKAVGILNGHTNLQCIAANTESTVAEVLFNLYIEKWWHLQIADHAPLTSRHNGLWLCNSLYGLSIMSRLAGWALITVRSTRPWVIPN